MLTDMTDNFDHDSHAETDHFDHDIFQSSRYAETDDLDHETPRSHSSHAETDYFNHDILQTQVETGSFDNDTFHPCWNWRFGPWILTMSYSSLPDMLKLTIFTITHFSHAETDNFDHYTFQTCWNWQFWPSITYSSHGETDDFDHDTFQLMLKWTILTMTHFSHAKTDDFDLNIYQSSRHAETNWRYLFGKLDACKLHSYSCHADNNMTSSEGAWGKSCPKKIALV
jgi:hypothetical protein